MLAAQVAAGIAPEWAKKNLADRQDVRFEPWMIFYWQAWNALRYERGHVGKHGEYEQPIYWTAIDRYASRHGIEAAAFDVLLRFVSTIDMAYLDLRAEERRLSAPPPRS